VLEVSDNLGVPESEFRFTYVASGGPGGQNVNKRSTKAVLRWHLRATSSIPPDMRDRFISHFGSRLTREGELVLTSDRFRDQSRNRKDCLEKLRQMLRSVEQPPRPRRASKPKRSSIERRLEIKKRRSATKKLRRPPTE